ncbi:MAG: dioxygenase [Euryarchaeota archaeon]|nr:dioxygenase [Euryarchaeota archaeon]
MDELENHKRTTARRGKGPGDEATQRLPALFVGHGSPMMALEDDAYTKALHDFGKSVQDIEAIAVISAHWERELPVRVTASQRPELIYDFFGFPQDLYDLEYPAKGDPALAKEIAKTLFATGVAVDKDERRGLDHGCWVPMRHLYPSADVPVIQISIPRPSNLTTLFRLGQLLAPFRSRGVLLVGSGNVVHNLRVTGPDKDGPVDRWAAEFDAWFRDRLDAMDVSGAIDYRRRAPHSMMAVPTTEHYDPALVVLGAALGHEKVRHVFEGIYNSNISMRCFAVGD